MKRKYLATMLLACVVAAIVSLSACAPQSGSVQAEGGSSDAAKQDPVAFTWSEDSDCATCHATESGSFSDAKCLAGSQHQSVACVTCHADKDALSAAHEGVSATDKMPEKLKATEVSSAACLSCHDSWDALAAKTADSTVLTDSQGKVVNPHALPAGHAEERATCSDCHSMHGATDATTDAPKVCIGCHHQNVYACNTCHA